MEKLEIELGGEGLDILKQTSEGESKGEKTDIENPLDILNKIKENTLTTNDKGSGYGESVDLSNLGENKETKEPEKSENIAIVEELPESSFFINVFDVVLSSGIYAVKKFFFNDNYCKPEDFALPTIQLKQLTKAFDPLYEKYKGKFSVELCFIIALVGAYGGRTLFATAESLKRKEKDEEIKKKKAFLEEKKEIEKSENPKPIRKSRSKKVQNG